MDARYIALETFNDRVLKRIIAKGSPYPPRGAKVPQSWVDSLLSSDNAVGRPMLETAQEHTQNAEMSKETALRAEADTLGVEYHPNIGYEKLLERVNEYKANNLGGD